MIRLLYLLLASLAIATASGCETVAERTAVVATNVADDQERTAVVSTIQSEPVTCATSKCDTALDVEPVEGGLYPDMTGFMRLIDRLPWENAQAPPDLLALSSLHLHRPRWVYQNNPVSFQASLQATLVPDHATGSGTPTFTRALAAYSGGYGPTDVIATGATLVQPASNEARFVGSRRIGSNNWSTSDNNGVPLTTTNGASSLYTDASGPFGYLSEGSRQNLALQSQTFDNATWLLSNALDMNAVAADAYVAPDGTTTMDKLQPKATNAAHYIYQALTPGAGSNTHSIYLRYVNHKWVAVSIYDGTNTRIASFDLQNGVAGALGAGTTSTITPTALTGVYRVSVTGTLSAALGNIGIVFNDIDSASVRTWNAAGTELVGVWGAQLEAASFASTYIPTTTVAVTRPADVDQYVSAGNIAATMTLYQEITPSVALGSATVYHWATYVDANNWTAQWSDGTNLYCSKRITGTTHSASIAWARTAGTAVKTACRFDGVNGSDVWLNGTKGTNDATTTAAQIGTNFQVGADGNGANQDYSEHRNLRVWLSSISDAQAATQTAFLDALMPYRVAWIDDYRKMAANDDEWMKVANRR